jgi:hypothetical protein
MLSPGNTAGKARARRYTRAMAYTLPDQPSDGLTSLVLRTDYGDSVAWHGALAAALAPQVQPWGDVFLAALHPVEDPALDGLGLDDISMLPRRSYLSHLFAADARTMLDHTFVVIDIPLTGAKGRWFRCLADQVQAVQNNLVLANMDFEEFERSKDDDGVFRGFPQP